MHLYTILNKESLCVIYFLYLFYNKILKIGDKNIKIDDDVYLFY
jgi:hypothetical protein